MSKPKIYDTSIFSCSPIDLCGQRFQNNGRTYRMMQPCNIQTDALTFTFSNAYGLTPLQIASATIAKCNSTGELVFSTITPITVNGSTSITLEPGALFKSDKISFSLQPGDFFAVSVYYPTDEPVNTGNWIAKDAQRSKYGNFAFDTTLPAHNLVSLLNHTITNTNLTVAITNLTEITAHSTKPSRVVACFGDSITEQGNWTIPFEKRLHLKYPGQISLCNAGISGNRLLKPGYNKKGLEYGIAGVDRFARDVLSLSGVHYIIMGLGSNDLGHPGNANGVPLTDLPTLEEYANALTSIAKQAHAKKIKLYVSTIAPRAINKVYVKERDELRKQMNDWIRSAPCFDAVFDYDAVLRRPDGSPGISDGNVLPDGLHPSPAGGLLLASSIDLSLFAN